MIRLIRYGLAIVVLLGSAGPIAAQTTRANLRDATGAEVGTLTNPLIIDAQGALSVAEFSGGTQGYLQNVTGNTTGSAQGVFGGTAIITVNCAGCAGGTTVSWEGTTDGVDYFALTARQLGTGTLVFASSTSTAGLTYWAMNTSGVGYVRVKVASYGSGTVTVSGISMASSPDHIYIANGTAATPLQVSLANTGANGTALKVDGSSVTQPVSGTVTANAGTGTFTVSGTVTANAGSGTQAVSAAALPLPSGASTSANQATEITALQLIDNLPNTLGSTTSGQSGALALGAVTTAAPTYTTAQSNALSLTTAGALRTDSSATTQPVSGAVTVSQGTGTNLHIVCDSGCSSSAGFGDNAAFTFGTTAVNPIAGVFDDVSSNTATENSAAVARITQNKALHVNFRNAAGTEIGTSSNPLQVTLANTGANATAVKVDGSAATQPVSGTVTVTQATGTNLHTVCDSGCSSSTAPADNSAFTAGTTSSSPMSAFFHSTIDTVTDGRIAAVGMDSKRNLFNVLRDAAGNARGANVTAANALVVDGSASTQPVSGTVTANAGIGTFAISAAALPLPSGASTAAKQPALGTAGTASADVLTVQGIASMTALKVDGSAVTQPVSGSVTANVGTTNGLALDATLTGGTQQTKLTDGTNVATVKAASTAAIATDKALVVAVSPNNAVAVTGTFWQATQPVSGTVTANAGTNLNTSALALDATLTGRLPAGASPADAESNTSTSLSRIGGYNFLYNGTTWDRWRGDTTSGAWVNVKNSTLAVTQSGSWSLAANQSVNVAQQNGAALASPDANSYAISPNAATATAAAAASACNILSAASTNATSCKGSAGNVYGYELYNTSTTVYYLRLYNLAAAPTCSSATGFIRSIPIPPAAAAGQVGGAVSNYAVPVNFGTGVGFCITGGSSSTDNTNAATGVFGEIRYK